MTGILTSFNTTVDSFEIYFNIFTINNIEPVHHQAEISGLMSE